MSNAQEELLQWRDKNVKDNPKIIHATERCASGIIQAVGHFKLGTNLSPRDVSDVAKDVENASPGHEIVKFNLVSEKWRRAEVEKSEQFLAGLKAVYVRQLSLSLKYFFTKEFHLFYISSSFVHFCVISLSNFLII